MQPRGVRRAIVSAALVSGMVSGALLVRYSRSRAPAVAPKMQAPKLEGRLALQIHSEGAALRLMWDPRSPELHSIDDATLEIQDGNHLSKLLLGKPELNSGSASYWPETKNVTFRLQLSGQKLGEMTAAVEAKPSPFVAPAKPVVPAPKRQWKASVSVETEPVSVSGVRKVVSRIPLLRRLNKPFVPPTPLHQVQPQLLVREREGIAAPEWVNVRVHVNEFGRVQSADLLPGAAHHQDLASAAVSAARLWNFVPARKGTEHVPGEVILHFHFAPPVLSSATDGNGFGGDSGSGERRR